MLIQIIKKHKILEEYQLSDNLPLFLNIDNHKQHYNGHLLKYYNFLKNKINTIKELFNSEFLYDIVIKSYGVMEHMSFYNNASQVLCHIMFWESFTNNNQDNIIPDSVFQLFCNSFDNIKNQNDIHNLIYDKGIQSFGSSWLFVVLLDDNKVNIIVTPNAFNPINIENTKEILVCIDLWEHVFYNEYQHNKGEYLKKCLQYINWKQCESFIR
ncbi:Superoxide dismutase [Fe] [bacterium AB1]|nr:Superoxide dismutase [Fe] [bacterium AB1]